MKRMTRGEKLMMQAHVESLRSSCERRRVGAIIAREGRILSTGYAGAPSGSLPCGPPICDLSKPCLRTIHAEANAIAFAARYGIATENSDLYCTASPCLDCAKLIINSGIRAVYYAIPYRDEGPIDLLMSHGILCRVQALPNPEDFEGIIDG